MNNFFLSDISLRWKNSLMDNFAASEIFECSITHNLLVEDPKIAHRKNLIKNLKKKVLPRLGLLSIQFVLSVVANNSPETYSLTVAVYLFCVVCGCN